MIWTNNKNLSDLATQPDQWRGKSCSSWASTMHYVNVPYKTPSFSMGTSSCSKGLCVVSAITNYSRVVQNAKPFYKPFDSNSCSEPSPLAFLIHFAGDVHQPLHVSYKEDSGGNALKVTFFGQMTNLHAVWDVGLIRKYMNVTWNLFAHRLIQEIDGSPGSFNSLSAATDPVAWASEAYQVTYKSAYTFTAGKAEEISDQEWLRRQARSPSSSTPVLGDKYGQIAWPQVKMQLKRGGARLAATLNRILR